MTTIVALSTAPMNCAIHIIRISGPAAFQIVNKITNKEIKKETFKIQRALIIDHNEVIDDVLVNTFVGPKTFTGEDLIEINCHGGVVVANMIIKLLIKNGATPAQRGEFSQRALLNKKMDLSAIEAINNLVNAKNELAAKGTVGALLGKVSKTISNFREQLFLLIGQIEVNIDYPEYDDVEQVDAIKLKTSLEQLHKQIAKIVQSSKRYLPINKGIKVLIIGKPNVGKSTLLNALANEEKAIVSDIPGTTRDVVETTINIDNITLNILDTAGIHTTDDLIENLGINKAKSLIDQVDLILYLVSSTEQDELELHHLVQHQNHLVVFTKKDLINKYDDTKLYINAKEQEIEPLIKAIKQLFHTHEFENSNQELLQSARQVGLLEQVQLIIEQVINHLNNNATVDLVIGDLEMCNHKLNEILGVGENYDFLDELFKNFCIGK
ncbi:tRNA modification GTPase TrmE [Ureaplasma diversum]|uniref:tRNA modification GTPase MnmE n=1 Tax=Ureaplasma diversum TaxID=42094 RepID=A0A0C5RMD8_9BACT|nr:tRNA uridine-5-carboxymethylaminomethyl(34) synthesis GTPase MnmE [Ureaplasma diversum]AJQ45592.1 tRNA modification GTPase TrmE [Ureaplasma diversum]